MSSGHGWSVRFLGQLHKHTIGKMSATKKLVVCGGNGFLGSRICKSAVARGWDVTSIRQVAPFTSRPHSTASKANSNPLSFLLTTFCSRSGEPLLVPATHATREATGRRERESPCNPRRPFHRRLRRMAWQPMARLVCADDPRPTREPCLLFRAQLHDDPRAARGPSAAGGSRSPRRRPPVRQAIGPARVQRLGPRRPQPRTRENVAIRPLRLRSTHPVCGDHAKPHRSATGHIDSPSPVGNSFDTECNQRRSR